MKKSNATDAVLGWDVLTLKRSGFTSDVPRWRAGIQARNPDAFEQIYREYSGRVMNFLSLVEPRRSPLEACLDVFEELWHSAAAGTLPGPLSEWIFHLAYRILLERARSAEGLSSERPPTVDSTCPAGATPNPRVDARSAVGGLCWEQRVIVALVYGARLSLDSISRITAVTDKEITGHLSEARDRLRHELLLAPDSRG